jgi:anti-sigma regulatory factor (Ser/Thr protein kinase)
MDHLSHDRDFCRSRYALDGKPGSISAALDHTRSFLQACNPYLDQDTLADLELLVSELVTNAVRHAPGPLTLALSCDGHVEVEVSDTSVRTPAPRKPDLRGGGGFGWHLVTTLADRLEIRMNPDGKTISAAINTP